MKVHLVSPYHTGSHRAWAEGYSRFSEHEVELFTLPGSFWQWRLTGGFIPLASRLAAAETPDVLLATSMLDVAGLRGHLPPRLRAVPIALYMHENQITYPPLGRSRTERNYGLITWSSLLAADAVAFNSAFHCDTLLAALPEFLGEFPDERHHSMIGSVAERAVVLPVGCELAGLAQGPKSDPPLIVWNHRWDADKDPAAFLRILGGLDPDAGDFRVALLGERFVNQRDDLGEAVRMLGDRVVVDGHLPRSRYLEVLAEATITLSTAHQEFFGISVLEAMHAGVLPLLPDRLVYPERVPERMASRILYRSEADAVRLLESALADPAATRRVGSQFPEITGRFDWSIVAPQYDAWLSAM